jgi:NAD(P)-dependent dehydrogenase (short-subunit alcohol dehydrogenase family)
VVINLSTVNHDGLLPNISDEQIDESLRVNVLGNVTLIKALLPKLRARSGRFIYMSSVLSTRPIRGTSMYGASKAFNDNFIKTMAQENAKYGLTFNSIQLGYFDAGLCHKVPENVMKGVIESIPLKRLGRIEEIANAIRFLIDTEYITGCNLKLNGGLD